MKKYIKTFDGFIKEGLSIGLNGEIIETPTKRFKIVAKHSSFGVGYNVIDFADSEEEAQQKVELHKDEKGKDYSVFMLEDDGSIDLDTPEGEKFFNDIVKKWNVKGSKYNTNATTYEFPLSAKKDLDALGIDWYEQERITNPDHPEYGKWYLTFNWTHRKY
jgi:hypothetical protein